MKTERGWIGLDVAPLLGSGTGVAEYVRGLWEYLPLPVVGCASVWGPRSVPGLTVAGGAARALRVRRIPGRILEMAWRWGMAPAERAFGSMSLFHSTGYLSPPRVRAPLVATIHDLSPIRVPRSMPGPTRHRFTRWIERTVARADRICVPTHAVAHDLTATFPEADPRVRVVPHGIDPTWFSFESPASHRVLPYVVSVGSVSRRKNLAVAIRGVAALRSTDRARFGSLEYWILGPMGYGAAQLRHEVEGAGWSGWVRFLGHRTQEQLMAEVAGAQALLYPSIYEGMGFPPLQAMALGVPVVASSTPTMIEVLGHHAELLPPDDPRAWAESLRALLPRSGRHKNLARAREHAKRITWKRTADETARVYEEVVADH